MNNQIIRFILNNSTIEAKVNPSLPLLDYIRKEKHLTGTKEVCKEGDCGACTVLLGTQYKDVINYKTITSCIYPIANCYGKHIVTIEGINTTELLLQQLEFANEHASQCGFCTPGFIMSLTCYLLNNDKYSLDAAVNAVAGNICRCTGYKSIERAITKVLTQLEGKTYDERIRFLIQQNVIPEYFSTIGKSLSTIKAQRKYSIKESSTFLSGGSDLFVQRADSLIDEDITFFNQQNLRYINQRDSEIEIGSSTTFEDFKKSDYINKLFPSLNDDIDLVASLPVRNAATIGGNLCNASPIGDLTIVLLAFNANLLLSDGDSERQLLLSEFYLDYKKLNKKMNEFIKSISFSIPNSSSKFSFEKVSKRTHLDIASVNTALWIESDSEIITDIRISAGGVSPIPMLLNHTTDYLIGKEIRTKTIIDSFNMTLSEIKPISDVRGSKEYKTLLLRQLIFAHFLKLFPEKIMLEELA